MGRGSSSGIPAAEHAGLRWKVCLGFLLAALWLVIAGGIDPLQAREWPSRPRIDSVRVADLPKEARQTLALIKSGGPFPYRRDGVTFQNRERVLPPRARDYYREYTVPTPGASTRGARRIVAGREADYYYSDDHYRSFRRIVEPGRNPP